MATFVWLDDFETGGEMHAVEKAADGLRLRPRPALHFVGAGRVALHLPHVQGPWTAEMWIRRFDATEASASILDGWYDPSYTQWGVVRMEQLSGTNRLGYTLRAVSDYASPYAYPIDALGHLAFVSDGSKLQVYHNDSLVWTLNVANLALPRYNLGASDIGTSNLRGYLHELRLWNRALSLEELQEVRWRHLHPETPGLLNYFRLDEGEGTSITDVCTGQSWPFTGTLQWVTEPKRFGHRELVLDLKLSGADYLSHIAWESTEPDGTGVTIETNLSLDGGQTWLGWKVCTNGGPIPDVGPGTDLTNARLKIWEHLHTTDPIVEPVLHLLQVAINNSRSRRLVPQSSAGRIHPVAHEGRVHPWS